MDFRTLCKKLPKPLQIPVWRMGLIVMGPVVLPLSCVAPAAKFVWELLGEYGELLTRKAL